MKEKLLNTLPYIILLIGFFFTFLLWESTKKINEARKAERFKSIERQIQYAINSRLSRYADAHVAGAGLFLSTPQVTRENWREFIETIDLMNRFPGINGIGYSALINKKDSAEFVKQSQKEISPDFKITGMGLVPGATDLYVIKYIEPESINHRAIGLDMGSEPIRRQAMDIAKDSGITTVSKKVILVQDASSSPGFLMYVPFYLNGDIPATLEERRKNFLGWIYAPFIAKNFIGGIRARGWSEIKDLVKIEVYDSTTTKPENLLYQSPNFTETKANVDQEVTILQIPVYNNTWTIKILPTQKFIKEYTSIYPWLFLIGGTLLSLSVFYIALLLSNTRKKAIALARKMTIELTHKKNELEEKNKELERSNRDLEQFAYVASHDLKEPLRMVSAYTGLLAKKYTNVLDQDGKQYIAYATEGAERMASLISDLLNYSKVGQSNTELTLTDLNLVMQDVIKQNELLIEEPGTQVICKNLPVIKASPNYMFSLFQNLLNNGIKFRKEEPPVIIIKAEKQNESWLFSISDNGIGIEPQYLDKIFIIFQRLHTRDKYTGTGIGLAICKKIVEFHGGTIWVESKPGEGTTFFFTLPEN